MTKQLDQLFARVPKDWTNGYHKTPTLHQVLTTFNIEELGRMFLSFRDPTGVLFTDSVLHGNVDFYNTLLATKELGPYLRGWEGNCAQMLIRDSLTFHQRVSVSSEATLGERMRAHKEVTNLTAKLSRLERESIAALKKASTVASRNNGDVEQGPPGLVQLDLTDELERIVKTDLKIN